MSLIKNIFFVAKATQEKLLLRFSESMVEFATGVFSDSVVGLDSRLDERKQRRWRDMTSTNRTTVISVMSQLQSFLTILQ